MYQTIKKKDSILFFYHYDGTLRGHLENIH